MATTHNTTTHPCFGCGTQIENTPGNYYCSACIAKQLAEQGTEHEAFDAYHNWVDRISATRKV